MKLFITFIFLFACLSGLNAQSDTDRVKAAVTRMFDAMKQADAAKLKSAFADSAVLQTITLSANGDAGVKNEPVDAFIAVIGKLTPGAADERIRFEAIKVDGPLASVWTPYSFYYNGTLSHCGVNSFQLVKVREEWKIQYIIDTRRKTGCL